jgi:hypothetical protein
VRVSTAPCRHSSPFTAFNLLLDGRRPWRAGLAAQAARPNAPSSSSIPWMGTSPAPARALGPAPSAARAGAGAVDAFLADLNEAVPALAAERRKSRGPRRLPAGHGRRHGRARRPPRPDRPPAHVGPAGLSAPRRQVHDRPRLAAIRAVLEAGFRKDVGKSASHAHRFFQGGGSARAGAISRKGLHALLQAPPQRNGGARGGAPPRIFFYPNPKTAVVSMQF